VKQKEEDDSDVVIDIHGVAASFPSSSTSTCKTEMGITGILKGPKRILPPFKGEHLERVLTSHTTPVSPKAKPVDPPHGWLMISSSHEDLHYDQVDHTW
jgi:hypothetical protein